MSKQQRNNDKLALLIGSCWFTLFAFWVFVLISGRYLEVACTNEQVIKVCNFIDNNKILLCVVKFAFYYFQSILMFYAILKKKIFSSNTIPISIYVLVIWLIKHFTSQYSFSNYLDFLSIIFIIILDKKKWALANGYNDTLTIDRINNKGNYEPSNCRWANYEEQANNTSNTKLLTFNNITLSLSQWSRKLNIKEPTLSARLKRGWSVEKALTTPPQKNLEKD